MESAVLSGLQFCSPAFKDRSPIPKRFAQTGLNMSPPLAWSGAPENTRTFALVVEDPDAVKGTFTHWLLYNVPSAVNHLEENVPLLAKLPNGALQGLNSRGVSGYLGPNPPFGMHRYFFYLYAVDRVLSLPPNVDRETLEHALQGHVVSEGRLMGTFTQGACD